MPVLDPIDLELWNEYFRAAIAGSSSDPNSTVKQTVQWAAAIADEAIEEYQRRMKEVESK